MTECYMESDLDVDSYLQLCSYSCMINSIYEDMRELSMANDKMGDVDYTRGTYSKIMLTAMH